jgi:hypothetical protein
LARRFSLVFAAGAVGALANSSCVWIAGTSGLTGALGVAIAPAVTPEWLYPRLVWGGIWGALFLLPLGGRRWLVQGALVSLGPTLVQLLVLFPRDPSQGRLGLELGALTPFFVAAFNLVWGVVAACWLRVTAPAPLPQRSAATPTAFWWRSAEHSHVTRRI